MLAPLPIDKKLMPLAQRLANKAITRHQAGEKVVELLLSPEGNKVGGRLHLLIGDIFQNHPSVSASVSSYTGPRHTGVIKVVFD